MIGQEPAIASVRHEIVIASDPESVWDAVRDVGAVHRRLLPGRVAGTRLEGDLRILTFPDGRTIRELIVAIDDEARRLAYAVVDGARDVTHHHASFQVLPEDDARSRLVWITDVLPHRLAPGVRARMERGALEMREAIEHAS